MRFLVMIICFGSPLNLNSSAATAPSSCSEPCCEHAADIDRPAGDAKNWGCSNHSPQHLAFARDIATVSKENGCKGWKRIR